MGNDLRYAIRTLAGNPGFTIVAVLTLAIGIGANTAIFSVVDGVLLRPLPYPQPSRLVQVMSSSTSEAMSGLAAADFLDLQRDNHTLSALAGYRDDALTIAAANGEPVRVQGARVTVDYFDVFASAADIGRTFNRAADGN